MILLAIVLAIVALAAAGITGWMIAQRSRSTAQRDQSSLLAATEQRATAAEVRVADLVEQAARRDAELAKIHHEAANARQAIGSLEASLAASQQTATQHEQASRNAQRALAEAHRALSEATAAQAKVRGELGVVQERLAQRESGQVREGRAVEEVQRVLAPLIERERLAGQLARLDIGRGTRGELPRLMDAIASLGGFSSVVLSDEVGLPLAVNQGSNDGEQLAGLWSLLLTVADRIATAGAPVPIAVVVHDAANQTILHRLFSSAGSRFLLTAVSRGRSLAPEALDPALTKLERLLAGSALAAS